MAYTGTVDLVAGLRPKNNGSFPLVKAHDVYIDDNNRLDDVLGRVDTATVAETIAYLNGQTELEENQNG